MIARLNILVIDDDEDDYFITSQYLEEITDFEVQCDWCYNGEKALSELTGNMYDAYFIDYRLGARTGLDILKQAIDEGCIKPVILLTGKGNDQIDKLSVEYGAYDYLVKNELSSEKLERSLRYAVERFRSFKIINDNEKKYKLLFENALSFIFTCNNVLQFTACNPASFLLLGYHPEELEGRSLLDFITEKNKAELREIISKKQTITNFLLEFQHQNGESVIGNLSLSFFELAGQDFYWQGIALNETIRLQQEQSNLHKEKLQATYRLVRTLAHEIRNPLTNIALSVEGLEEDKLPLQVQYLDIIKRNSSRINDIITDILQSAKTVELKQELYDLVLVVKEALDVASDRIKLKNIDLITSFPDRQVIKSIDVEKFRIAILNLIVNSIEAMEGEVKELSVTVSQTLDATQIIIKDSGIGISESNLKNLFEPYFTTKKTGMGLGLISVLNIIKSHKGDIKVDSKENQGTSFTIFFQH